VRTFFVTGATRGIGRSIALAAAGTGANVALLGKTVRPHRVLPGTLPEVAAEVERAGGRALPLETDVRDERKIREAIAATVRELGGIDVVVNNAGAISLTRTEDTPVRIFDRMMAVNVRACWVTSREAIPHLRAADNPHIVNLAPPLSLDPKWLGPHVAYTISKYGMSLATLGLAEELREDGIAVNGLWPRTVIATAALRMIPGIEEGECRTEAIVADAALALVGRSARENTGRLLLDEEILRDNGVTDFSGYAVDPGRVLLPDLFVDS
jgi:citronellol/citronellal dehydrogenase